MACVIHAAHAQRLDQTVDAVRQDVQLHRLVLVQDEIRDGDEVVRGRRGVERLRAGEEPFEVQRVVAHINEVRHPLAEPVDLQRLLVPQFADAREVVLTLAVAVGVERLRALVGRNLARHVCAETLYERLLGHVDPAPYLTYFFPSAAL